MRQSAESLAETVRISAELPKRAAETAQETINGTLSAATQVAQRTAEQVSRTWRGATENPPPPPPLKPRAESLSRPHHRVRLRAQFTMVRREMELFLERDARLAQLSARSRRSTPDSA